MNELDKDYILGLMVLTMKVLFLLEKGMVGTYYSADGTSYFGEWFDDLQHGEGNLSEHDGTVLVDLEKWKNYHKTVNSSFNLLKTRFRNQILANLKIMLMNLNQNNFSGCRKRK